MAQRPSSRSRGGGGTRGGWLRLVLALVVVALVAVGVALDRGWVGGGPVAAAVAARAAEDPAAAAPEPQVTLEVLLGDRSLPTCSQVIMAPPHSFPGPFDFYKAAPALFLPNDTVLRAARPGHLALPAAARRLMVVAHADDELLFGGSDLVAGPPGAWLVVIVNRVGVREGILPNVTRHFDLAGLLILEHYEKWELTYYDTRCVRDLDTLLHARAWEVVVTHEAGGEYGNTQHRALSIVVAALVSQPTVRAGALRIFQFHKRGAPPETRADEAVYVRLRAALEMYGAKIVASFGAMVRSSGPSLDASANVGLANLTAVLCQPTADDLVRYHARL
jgi:hypothetical protein